MSDERAYFGICITVAAASHLMLVKLERTGCLLLQPIDWMGKSGRLGQWWWYIYEVDVWAKRERTTSNECVFSAFSPGGPLYLSFSITVICKSPSRHVTSASPPAQLRVFPTRV